MDDNDSDFGNAFGSQGQNLYDMLGVSAEASPDAIKKAYRILALKYHPDKNPGDNDCKDRFQQINYAYSILSDTNKRKFYDLYGHFGLDLFNHVGEDKAEILLKFDNPCTKAILFLSCLLTGCCFCYCCFCMCCYNFCCGLCSPAGNAAEFTDGSDQTLNQELEADEKLTLRHGESRSGDGVVNSQPMSVNNNINTDYNTM